MTVCEHLPISVCLLSHNSCDTIEDSIRSVLEQTNTNWRMLVYDDASTDDTDKIVEQFLCDERITLRKQQANVGQARNWGAAISAVETPIIGTLHADDTWGERTLEHVANCFAEDISIDFLIGNWLRMDCKLEHVLRSGPNESDLSFYDEDCLRYICENNITLPSASFFSRDLANKVKAPNEQYPMLCDREFFLRIASRSHHLKVSSQLFANYRTNPEGVTAQETGSMRVLSECYAISKELPAITSEHSDSSRLCEVLGDEFALMIYRAQWRAVLRAEVSPADPRCEQWKSWADAMYSGKPLVLKDRVLRFLARRSVSGMKLYQGLRFVKQRMRRTLDQ